MHQSCEVDIPADWIDYFDRKQVDEVLEKVKTDIDEGINICPKFSDIFEAFHQCPYNKVRIIILGQDPYPNPNHAHGLAFSSQHPFEVPKSLKNIFKVVDEDIYFGNDSIDSYNPDLTRWANQGILLLNSYLTTIEGVPMAHKDYGWEAITDRVIKQLGEDWDNLIFVFWGEEAKKKKKLIDPDHHYVLETSHPSPLSFHKGFDKCQHFSSINNILMSQGEEIIEW